MTMNNTPYANLDPNLILSAVESLGLSCNGSLFALNSYENRVYQIGIEGEAPVIAKFYRPLRWSNEIILEEHQFALELNEYEIPVVAPLIINNKTLHDFEEFRFSLFPRWGGRALEVDSLEQLEWMGRFIGRLHAVSACRKFKFRQALNVQTYGHASHDFLLKNNFIPDYMRQNYCAVADEALQLIEECFQQVGEIRPIRLHGDIHAGNVLWNQEGPHIVDLDDCVMGPAIQDIWMLLSGDKDQVEIQLQSILKGYSKFYDFDNRELRLIEALRTLRMLHYSAWLARRWDDPAFPMSFPWFNTPRYWEQQMRDLQEQIAGICAI